MALQDPLQTTRHIYGAKRVPLLIPLSCLLLDTPLELTGTLGMPETLVPIVDCKSQY
jgi:hypothetical protein